LESELATTIGHDEAGWHSYTGTLVRDVMNRRARTVLIETSFTSRAALLSYSEMLESCEISVLTYYA
jgi:hypothetical protein